MYAGRLSDWLVLDRVGRLALTFVLHEYVLELRRGSGWEVGHRERKVLIVRVEYGMARRGRGRLLGGPVCRRGLMSVLEREVVS